MLAIVALVCGVPLVIGARAGAAAGIGEHVERFDSNIRIQRNGTVRVRETIDYDFGVVPRHGILRVIPVRFDYTPKADTDRVYRLDVLSVRASEETPSQYTIDTIDDGKKQIKIGDPDRTITGVHRYEVTYTLKGALNGFRDHDELYLNALSPDSGVPINELTVRVEAPADIRKINCFTGPLGSNLPCAVAEASGSTATFAQPNVPPYSGLTFTVALPKGVVPPPTPILEERFSLARAFSLTPFTVGFGGALLLLIVAGWAILQYRFGRDRRYTGSAVDTAFGSATGAEELVPLAGKGETPVEFVPPDDLRPGQIGTLIDFSANPLDVTATIVDLAVRKYLVIEELAGEGWTQKPDWKLTKKKEPGDELKDYEREVLEALFRNGDEVELSDLRQKFGARMRRIQKALTDDAKAQGWFARPPSSTRVQWGCLAVLVLVFGVGLTILLAAFTHDALLGIPVIVAGILLMFGAYWMPQRTAKGTAVLRRADGFRRFIDESEKERARFAERKNLFSEYLPYAIVFGATEKWARAFSGLDDQPPDTSSWYVSSHVFTFAAFSSAIDGFTVSTSGTLTSTPPSSSGSSGFSSGGGFSGGGGGGGSVGSW